MKRVRLIALCLMLALVAGAVWAADAEAKWWPKEGPGKPMAIGVAANVSPTAIAVQTKEGVKTFVVVAQTKVLVQGRKAAIGDVKVGDQVAVHFKPVPNAAPIALRILVPKPNVTGKILSFASNMLVLQTKTGEQKVIVTDKTPIKSHGYIGTPADLRVGYGATAIGKVTEGALVADAIEFRPPVVKGTVTAIENGIITIKTVKQRLVAVQPSEKTFVLIRPRVGPNVKGKIEDVKVGSPVNAGIHAVKDGPSPLLWIDVMTGM